MRVLAFSPDRLASFLADCLGQKYHICMYRNQSRLHTYIPEYLSLKTTFFFLLWKIYFLSNFIDIFKIVHEVLRYAGLKSPRQGGSMQQIKNGMVNQISEEAPLNCILFDLFLRITFFSASDPLLYTGKAENLSLNLTQQL